VPIHAFVRRIRYLLNRGRYDEELSNDLEVHREMAAREGRRLGNALRLTTAAHRAVFLPKTRSKSAANGAIEFGRARQARIR
jgi:hypothetical protein